MRRYGAASQLLLQTGSVLEAQCFGAFASDPFPSSPLLILSSILSRARAFSSGLSKDGEYKLITWGRGDHGNLGHGRRETRWDPEPIELPINTPPPSSGPPPSVSCGFVHTTCLVNDQMFSFGKGGGGRLGCGRDTDIEFPSQVLFPTGITPTKVSCGGLHSGAIDSRGQLWMWGYAGMGSLGSVERKGSFWGTLLAFMQGQHKVKLVWPHESFGPWNTGLDLYELQRLSRDLTHHEKRPDFMFDHRMYLPGELATKLTPFASLADRAVKEKVRILDQIRTLGLDPDFELASSRGEVNLGTGNELLWAAFDQPTEQGASPPPADPLVHVSCGAAHTLVVSAAGNLYSFGYDEGEGRLGIIEKWQEGPRRVHMAGAPGARMRHAAAGHKHSAAVDDEGRVWTFGSNQNGELGTGRVDRGGPFTLQVAALHHERIVQVACGAQHTAALTAGGSVYVWGSNAEGQLGLGEGAGTPHPTPTLLKSLRSVHVKSIACGAKSTFVLTTEGEVFSFGLNSYGALGQGYNESKDVPVYWQPARSPHLRNVVSLSVGAAHGAAWVRADP